tara:strand:- start:3122 stop:5122 length:2001 start_codon:yes stop_codon:yes gene_type:complete
MSYKIGARRAQDIVSGTFDKDRVSEVQEGAVTAHEEALEPLLQLDKLSVTDLDMGDNVIKFSQDPSGADEASRKGYVDTGDATVQAAVDAEKARAEAAEAANAASVSSEASRAQAAESALASDIVAEAALRVSADNSLSSRLDAVEGGLVAGVVWKDSLADIAALDSLTEGAVEAGWAYYIQATTDVYVCVSGSAGDHRPAGWSSKGFIKVADFSELSGLVTAEENARTTAIAAVQADVDQNESDSDAAHASATSDRAAIRSEFAAADSSEASTRASADTTLQGNIDAEATARASADTTLQGNIDAEAATRLSADNSATADRAAIRSEFASADATEKARAEAAEAANTAAIAAVQSDVDQNESDSDAAHSAATSDRAAIRSEFAAADSSLQTSLQAGIDTEKGRIDAILLAADADKDSFAEIVTLINSVDTTNDNALASAISTLNASIAAVQADVDSNETDSDAADAAIQSALDTFKARTDNPHNVTPAQLSLVPGTDVQAYDATLQQLSNAYHADDGSYFPVYYGDNYNGADGEANTVYYQRIGRFGAPIVEAVADLFCGGTKTEIYSFNEKYQMINCSGLPSSTGSHTIELPEIDTDYSTGDLGRMMVLKCDALLDGGSGAVSLSIEPKGTGTTANIDGGSSFTLDDPYSALTLVATSTGWRIV